MYTFCISIEAQDKFFWQLYFALKSYERSMCPATPFNVVATVAIDEQNYHHITEYEDILIQMQEEFPFFYWLSHEVVTEKGYPRSYHKIAGPSLLNQAPFWPEIKENILIVDPDVWLVKSFSKEFKIYPGELRFWKASGIGPDFKSLVDFPYGPELVFAAGFREEDLESKWFEHSAYYMFHKEDFEEWFKDQKEMYQKLYPVFLHVDQVDKKYSNYGSWFCEMYAANFTACSDKWRVMFFDDYFHCGNATKETFYFLCTFLHFFVNEDQVFWSKFWDWTFPFTDKEWAAIENAFLEIPKALLGKGLYCNTEYILSTLLDHQEAMNLYRDCRPINYNDHKPLRAHKSSECEFCIKTLEGK